MRYYTLLKRGYDHPEFCQDFLFSENYKNGLYIGAVFDGCSSGVDSHFASSLFSKIIAESVRLEILNFGELDLKQFSEKVFYNFMIKLKETKKNLHLTQNEILSTFLMMVYERDAKSACIIAAGDGVININGEIKIIDQNNKPKYPAYFIDEIENFDDFSRWNENENLNIFVQDVKDISISTDGISSFVKRNPAEISEFDVFDFLLNNNELKQIEVMLKRKYNIICNKQNMQNYDDIAVIRIIAS